MAIATRAYDNKGLLEFLGGGSKRGDMQIIIVSGGRDMPLYKL